MNAMIVGADRLGNIPDLLGSLGITVVEHVSGRSPSHQRRLNGSPGDIDLLILFTDFLGHNVMKSFRELGKRHGLRVVACRRSASCLIQSLAGVATRAAQGCEGCPHGVRKG
ncbi:MAG: DUF2325 domain-containing protein [Betaproteobacteria bacterium]|nr:DUF2325 domain-containing protein [Betaproteobacteria bacterium]